MDTVVKTLCDNEILCLNRQIYLGALSSLKQQIQALHS